WRQLRQGAETDGAKNRQALASGRRKAVGTVDRDADLRALRLVWLRRHVNAAEVEVFARVGQRLVQPGALDDLKRLGESLLALCVGDAISLIDARKAAASHTEDQSPMADLIDGRHFFGEAHRVAQRQHLYSGADLHPLG